MASARIVIVGAGSYKWGPLIVRDLVVAPGLCGSTIVMHDIDPEALDLVFALGTKIVEDNDLPFALEKALRLEEALRGADFVILTISTGGLEAMRHDLEIPGRHGVFQSVGDTVGPGGLARALRNIPVVVDVAREMERVCPDAWLLNYTNPMTTLCRAVARTTAVPVIGLCHEFTGVMDRLRLWFDVEDRSEIRARVGGINHFTWITELTVRGRDAFPELQEFARQALAARDQLDGLDFSRSTVDHNMVKASLFRVFGAFPAAGDRHLAEFFPLFLTESADKGRQYGVMLTTIEERYRWLDESKSLLQAVLSGGGEAKRFLQPSGEAVAPLISAVVNGERYVGVLNLPNQGQILNLPAEVVVETYGLADAAGARGLAFGTLPPGIHNLVHTHVINQEMIVEAALSGNKNLALRALLNDPLVREFDGAERMLDQMLMANRQYLPQFFA